MGTARSPALISLRRGTSCPLSQEIKADLCGVGGKHQLCPCQVSWHQNSPGRRRLQSGEPCSALPKSCCLPRRCHSRDCALRGEGSPPGAQGLLDPEENIPPPCLASPGHEKQGPRPSLPALFVFWIFCLPEPPWLFSPHCDAVSGFTNSPSSWASPSSSKLLICLGALAVG